jgi:hypothetical protein
MAARYWVGGTESWDTTAGSKWSLTSGGSGGQAVPTSSDTVFFNASSGAVTVTIASGAICSTLTMTGFTGTLAFGSNNIEVAGTGTVYTGATTFSVTGTPLILSTNESDVRTFNTTAVTEANAISFDIGQNDFGGQNITFAASARVKNLNFNAGTYPFDFTWRPGAGLIIYGDLTMNLDMGVSAFGAGGSPTITFAKTGGIQNITSSNAYTGFDVTFSGTATYKLQNNFTVSAYITRTVTLSSGTLDLNGYTLNTSGGFVIGAGTKNITFNGGALFCFGTFNNANPTGFTTTAGTGTGYIYISYLTDVDFIGGGSTYNCTLFNAFDGDIQITGSNTFDNIVNDPQFLGFVYFEAGSTNTFNNFNFLGSAGLLVTIGSITPGSTFTLSKSSGTVSTDYLSISDSVATGGAGWYAGANSTDGGNNSGWMFTAPPSGGPTGSFFAFF